MFVDKHDEREPCNSKQTIKKKGIERENEIKIETGDKPQNILSRH